MSLESSRLLRAVQLGRAAVVRRSRLPKCFSRPHRGGVPSRPVAFGSQFQHLSSVETQTLKHSFG